VSDRSSACLIGDTMRYLARDATPANRKLAKWLYRKAQHYDFSDCQMEADAALVKLGLARRCTRHREMVLYRPGDECEECQYEAEAKPVADRLVITAEELGGKEQPRLVPRITDDVAGRWSW
jgi:hypothetical protein